MTNRNNKTIDACDFQEVLVLLRSVPVGTDCFGRR